jgi:hypothetical protein
LLTFSKLKQIETDAIQQIRTLGVFGKLSTLQNAAHKAQIVKSSRAPLNVHLSFTLPTRLREDGGRQAVERPFHVGCIAVPAGDAISQLSYSVLIGQDAHPSKLVARKFHFDFEPVVGRNVAESKPTFHLQMCGELSPHHEGEGYAEEDIAHLLPAWSQPRVPAFPMSLALVLNWLFIEFGHEPAVMDARQNPHWRSLVRDAEREVLKPYFDQCSRFLSDTANNDESFFSKHLYQEG